MAYDTDSKIAAIDRDRVSHFSRDPDRPGSKRPVKAKPAEVVKKTRRRTGKQAEPPEVVRAKTRRRVAALRVENDRRGRPEARELGLAALDALLRSLTTLDEVTLQQHVVVSGLLVDLKAAGYSLQEVLKVMKQRRAKLLANAAQ